MYAIKYSRHNYVIGIFFNFDISSRVETDIISELEIFSPIYFPQIWQYFPQIKE